MADTAVQLVNQQVREADTKLLLELFSKEALAVAML
jgi:hypothetical protein